jgi:hypothetical protein
MSLAAVAMKPFADKLSQVIAYINQEQYGAVPRRM